jgi:hypothetical protein
VTKLHGRDSGWCLVGPWTYHSSTECTHDPEKPVVSSQIECTILAKVLTQLADWVAWVNIQIIGMIYNYVGLVPTTSPMKANYVLGIFSICGCFSNQTLVYHKIWHKQ